MLNSEHKQRVECVSDWLNAEAHPVLKALTDLKQAVSFEDLVPP